MPLRLPPNVTTAAPSYNQDRSYTLINGNLGGYYRFTPVHQEVEDAQPDPEGCVIVEYSRRGEKVWYYLNTAEAREMYKGLLKKGWELF